MIYGMKRFMNHYNVTLYIAAYYIYVHSEKNSLHMLKNTNDLSILWSQGWSYVSIQEYQVTRVVVRSNVPIQKLSWPQGWLQVRNGRRLVVEIKAHFDFVMRSQTGRRLVQNGFDRLYGRIFVCGESNNSSSAIRLTSARQVISTPMH